MSTETLEQKATDRIRWEAIEIDRVARAFIEERKRSPFAPTTALLEAAQKQALPDDRQRPIGSVTAMPALEQRIATLWVTFVNQKDPPPEVIHVQTQSPPDYVELTNRLDAASLTAMLVTKLTKEVDTWKPLLVQLAGKEVHMGAPLNPPVSILAAASKKQEKPNVLIMGPTGDQFRHIETKVREQEIPVDLQFLDKDKPRNGVRVKTDFVIATRFIQHGLEEAIKTKVPKGCYFFMDEQSGITAVVQKCRDIASMCRPRMAA